MNMLSERYESALRRHFAKASVASLHTAAELGRRAVALGMDTLDLARVHDHALTSLMIVKDRSPSERNDLAARGGIFFNEAISPIEATHGAANDAAAEMARLNETLENNAAELADSNRELKQSIIGRVKAEATLEASVSRSADLLRESRLQEEHLKQMTHEILAATEEDRKRMSLQLHDEVAQTLLGILVKLLALRKGIATNQADLTEEIATTQRLVKESVTAIGRFNGEFALKHEE